jgi:CHAT domain-containing protein
VYAEQRQFKQALDYYQQALSLSRVLGMRDGEAETLYEIGVIHRTTDRIKEALNCFFNALPLSRAIMDQRTEMKTLYEIAKIKHQQGELEQSRQHIEAVLSIVDLLHTRIANQEQRASYFASAQMYYEFYISLLMRLHRQKPSQGLDAVALQVSEQARARSLLETLTGASADIVRGVDPSPSYGALTQPRFLSTTEIQSQVVNGDTLLLEYALCEDSSFLWAVTSDSVVSYELPARAVIEAAAQEVYKLLTEPALTGATRSEGKSQMRQDFEGMEPPLWEGQYVAGYMKYREASLKLSNMLLGPAAGQLRKKRLLIVTQGALHRIPFGALPLPSGAESKPSDLPLMVHHEILYSPSASLLPMLRSEAARRKKPAMTVAVIADPVLEKDDPRVDRNSATPVGSSQSNTRTSPSSLSVSNTPKWSISAVEGYRFPRLLGAQWEAERIISFAPLGGSMQAVGFAANRTNTIGSALNGYRIIHFATHALVNDQRPELSGILLSSFDKQGLQQDGFLNMNDILNLNLSADLVVLSACSTGLGKEVRGEGIVGLTRAFMYAGASSVVVSLWNVEDRATANLMAQFYEKMLKEKREPADALRAAQIAIWRNGSRHPYYWAGFVLQGNGTLTE